MSCRYLSNPFDHACSALNGYREFVHNGTKRNECLKTVYPSDEENSAFVSGFYRAFEWGQETTVGRLGPSALISPTRSPRDLNIPCWATCICDSLPELDIEALSTEYSRDYFRVNKTYPDHNDAWRYGFSAAIRWAKKKRLETV